MYCDANDYNHNIIKYFLVLTIKNDDVVFKNDDIVSQYIIQYIFTTLCV